MIETEAAPGREDHRQNNAGSSGNTGGDEVIVFDMKSMEQRQRAQS
jgi:hypothetical protein